MSLVATVIWHLTVQRHSTVSLTMSLVPTDSQAVSHTVVNVNIVTHESCMTHTDDRRAAAGLRHSSCWLILTTTAVCVGFLLQLSAPSHKQHV